MNPDAIVLLLLAMADLALIVHLRRRHATHERKKRMMACLRRAVRRENGVGELRSKRRFLRAS